jgi:hypothetical protein
VSSKIASPVLLAKSARTTVSFPVSAFLLRESNSQPTTASPMTTMVAPAAAAHRNRVDFAEGLNPVAADPTALGPDSVSRFSRRKSVRMSAAF